MLNEDTMRIFELKLQTRHAQLKSALSGGSGGREVALDQAYGSSPSRNAAMAEQEMSVAKPAPTHTELRRVDAAIGRLKNGRYGVCCRCQDRVEVSLLHSDPATPFCLSCLEEMVDERQSGLQRR